MATVQERETPRSYGPELKPLRKRCKVLVVDDEPMMLTVLTSMLAHENLDILTATGGEEALRAATDTGPALDLLVTDYNMPGMSGRELADRVRALNPPVKVLYQTGFSDDLFSGVLELEENAAFLDKPFTPRGLREAVRFLMFGTLNP